MGYGLALLDGMIVWHQESTGVVVEVVRDNEVRWKWYFKQRASFGHTPILSRPSCVIFKDRSVRGVGCQNDNIGICLIDVLVRWFKICGHINSTLADREVPNGPGSKRPLIRIAPGWSWGRSELGKHRRGRKKKAPAQSKTQPRWYAVGGLERTNMRGGRTTTSSVNRKTK